MLSPNQSSVEDSSAIDLVVGRLLKRTRSNQGGNLPGILCVVLLEKTDDSVISAVSDVGVSTLGNIFHDDVSSNIALGLCLPSASICL